MDVKAEAIIIIWYKATQLKVYLEFQVKCTFIFTFVNIYHSVSPSTEFIFRY